MSHQRRLRCPDCDFTAVCGLAEMLRWVQTAGMMRRAKEPDQAVIEELFSQTADRFPCPDCGRAGLLVEDAEDDQSEEAWGMARKCARCGQPIPAERLEAVPNATHCAACQREADSLDASDTAEAEYCPRCGSIMSLRQVRSRGVARYAMICPECGR
jgi:predicted RNA-binding Zn-ribbon protein involved in translation (DUF1610 family)